MSGKPKKDSDEGVRYLICQKTGKKVKITDKMKCLKPNEPCKYRLECPIYIAWKSTE